MPVAQGIVKTTAIAKQVALGTPFAGAGGQVLRRTSSVFVAARDTFENNEIRTDQQSSGVTYGLKKTTGKLQGLLSPATYKLLCASILRKDFVAGATTGAIIIVTSASTTGAQGTFTRSGGSYLTDGFKIGDIIRWTGWATTGASNNSINMLIIALTALIMTVTRFDGIAVGAKAAGDSVTGVVVGKKTYAPLTGHTNDYFTVEEWYSDVGRSEVFNDLKVSQIDIGLPATGNGTFSADFLGLSRTLGAAQVLTAPTAVTTTPVVNSANGLLLANGAVVGNVTGLSVTISGSMQQGEAVIGSNSAVDIARGRIKVTGQFTALFTDAVLSLLYDQETPLGLVGVMMDNPLVGTSDFMTVSMSRIKITSDSPDDGEKVIVRTYQFVAEININGGVALANDQTILTIQDSAA
jgi:hypothetical protein